MHACDIIAWHYNGAAFCPDCQPMPDADVVRRAGGEPHPVFADSIEEENGATCDDCSACLVSGEWLSHEEATAHRTRWSYCLECGSQKPFSPSDYRRQRRLSMFRAFGCYECGRKACVRFHPARSRAMKGN